MGEKLKKWQILYIDNIKYEVINMIEYKEDTWIWQEYEIKNESSIRSKWLCVEKDEYGKEEYSIYEPYYESINENEMSFYVDGYEYELYEKGIAFVNDYFGNADVDICEKCEYIDYITKDSKYVISIEKWGTEIEKSKGEYIDSSRLKITNEINIEKVEKEKRERRQSNIIGIIVGIIVLSPTIFPILAPAFSGLFVNKSIQKYIEKNLTYTYVTSITNNINNKKAKVYKSSLQTIDQTVRDIIDGVPEGITKTIDSEPYIDEDGIGIHTKKEFAYVYLENGIVYVQVSEKKYLDNTGGTIYHGSHSSYYSKSYVSTRQSNTYSNYSYSARQESINSRTTSGGGTSSGK